MSRDAQIASHLDTLRTQGFSSHRGMGSSDNARRGTSSRRSVHTALRRHAYAIFLPIAICLSLIRDPVFLVLPFALLLADATWVSLPLGSPFWLRPSPVVAIGIALATCGVAIEPIIKSSLIGVAMPGIPRAGPRTQTGVGDSVAGWA